MIAESSIIADRYSTSRPRLGKARTALLSVLPQSLLMMSFTWAASAILSGTVPLYFHVSGYINLLWLALVMLKSIQLCLTSSPCHSSVSSSGVFSPQSLFFLFELLAYISGGIGGVLVMSHNSIGHICFALSVLVMAGIHLRHVKKTSFLHVKQFEKTMMSVCFLEFFIFILLAPQAIWHQSVFQTVGIFFISITGLAAIILAFYAILESHCLKVGFNDMRQNIPSDDDIEAYSALRPAKLQ